MKSGGKVILVLLTVFMAATIILTGIMTGNAIQAQEYVPPTVSTNDASDITWDSAKLNGTLSALGTAAAVEVSFEWGENEDGPYPNETTAETANVTGAFSFDLTGLSLDTTYYFRAKVDGDIHGTGYGLEKSFTTLLGRLPPPAPPPVPVPVPAPPPAPMPAPAPAPAPTPAPPPPEPSPTLEELTQQALDRLTLGQMAFNPPAEMKIGVTEQIEVWLSYEEITKDMTRKFIGPGRPVIEQIKMGTFMTVTLMGDNFHIKAISSESQLVKEGELTKWAWSVLPLKSGNQELQLRITARIVIENIPEQEKDIEVVYKSVNVKVNPPYSIIHFFKSHWQWIVGTVISIAAVAGAIIPIIARRRRANIEVASKEQKAE